MSHEKESHSDEAEEKGGGYVAENIYESTSDFWGSNDSLSESSTGSSGSAVDSDDSSNGTTGHGSGQEG